MKTVTIQTGNTDNKLTQQEWAMLINLLEAQINIYAKENVAKCRVGNTRRTSATRNAKRKNH